MTRPAREATVPVARRAVVVCLAGLLALSFATGGAVAMDGDSTSEDAIPSEDTTATQGTVAIEEPGDGYFLVELDADGDAAVEYTNHTDLTDDDQREWFESVRDDEETREAVAAQRREEMQFVSDQANEHVDRDVRAGEVSVETGTDGDVGIVTYRFEWKNLAAVDGDRVILAEPFSLYDQFDRELVVVAPAGYELTSVTPEPGHHNETTASWPGLTDLAGFEVVATGEGDDGDAGDDGSFADGAGFGVSLAVGSLLAATLLVRRQQ